LELSGIGAERLHLAWVSSAEAQRFVEIVTTVTESVVRQGPFDPGAYPLALKAAEMTLDSEVIRWLAGKEVRITSRGDVYGRSWDTERLEKIMDEVLAREYQKNLIYLAIGEGAVSVREISAATGLELMRVSYLLTDLEKTNRVEFKGMHDRKPVFGVL
jgi:hypothetical protein